MLLLFQNVYILTYMLYSYRFNSFHSVEHQIAPFKLLIC